MAADEGEDGIVGGIAVWLLAEDQVVETRVDGAYLYGVRTQFLYPHANLLDHFGVQYGIAILETGVVIATVYLAAGVHDQHWNGKFL